MPERSNNTVFTFGLTADQTDPQEDGLSYPDFVSPKEAKKTDWKQEQTKKPLSKPEEKAFQTHRAEHPEQTQTDPVNENPKKEEDEKSDPSSDAGQNREEAARLQADQGGKPLEAQENHTTDNFQNESAFEKVAEAPELETVPSSDEEPEFVKAFFLEQTDDDQSEAFEEETDTISIPPVPACLSRFYRGSDLFVFNITQTGESHVKNETECQDYSGFEVVGDRIVLAAIADGVGSCIHSDWGARVAVSESLQYMKNYFTAALEKHDFVFDDVLAMGPLLQETMHRALRKISEKADEFNVLDYAMHTTLTIAAYDGKTLYFAHAGDDGIVILQDDGGYKMITHRHKGPEASSVFPLQSTTTWQYGKEMHIAGFVMATDGLLDYFVRSAFEDNRVFFPFIRPILFTPIEDQKQAETLHHDLEDFLNSPRLRKAVTDDLSLIGVVNEKKMQQIVEPEFDIEHWKAMTKVYERQKQKALYPGLFEDKDEDEKAKKTGDAASKPENTTLPDFPSSQPPPLKPADLHALESPTAAHPEEIKDENTFGDKLLRNVGAAASYLGRKLVKAGQDLEERASRDSKKVREMKEKSDSDRES
ncbi:PP2C family serine/threonine-protein phosphatase [Erysipelotrichaceae bacterium 51-3]